MRIPSLAAACVGAAVLTAPVAVAAPESCAGLGGTVQGGDCHVQAGDSTYTMEMTFPLGYPDEQAIVDYLRQTSEGFVNVAKSPDLLHQPLEMDVTAESLRSAQTRSVVLKLFQDVGTAHPSTWYRSFTYDTARGTPVTFDTLFAPGSKPLDVIFPIVQRELETGTGLTGSISPGDGRDASHYQNFAVTDDAVIFYFGQAELLPSYAGETSVTVPRSALPPLAL